MMGGDLGRLLIVVGVVIALTGVVLVLVPKLPGLSWFGRLPGDLYVDRPHLKVYLPLTTCLIASLVLSILLYVLRR